MGGKRTTLVVLSCTLLAHFEPRLFSLIVIDTIQQMVERGFSADASTRELIVDLLSKDDVDPALLPLIKETSRS